MYSIALNRSIVMSSWESERIVRVPDHKLTNIYRPMALSVLAVSRPRRMAGATLADKAVASLRIRFFQEEFTLCAAQFSGRASKSLGLT